MKICIIGGGVVAASLARELSIRYPDNGISITILEKESSCGSHASTRNSGVMHAGFYYSQNSHKAKFCAAANHLLRNYFLENCIAHKKAGKVVVTSSSADETILSELYKRGKDNGCDVSLFDKAVLPSYEPLAKTSECFLWSPNTWSGSPHHFFKVLISEILERGVQINTSSQVVQIESKSLILHDGSRIPFDYLINAAGGYSLSLANKIGLAEQFSLLPFKGLYLKSIHPCDKFTRHIYPVPNVSQPFLGVHTTLTSDGYLKLGPTAIPVFSPENYKFFVGLDMSLMPSIVSTQLQCLLTNSFGFRDLALTEFKYLFKNNIVTAAQKLTNLKLSNVQFDWYSPGIRAQLYNKISKRLEMDFVFEQTDSSFHLLNSISPAWTCCFATARYVVDLMDLSLS